MKFKRYCLLGFLKYFDEFVFKELEFLQTPCNFVYDLGCVLERGSKGIYGF